MDWQRKKSSFAFWFLYLIVVCLGAFTISQAFCDQREIKGNFIWLLFAGVLLFGGLFSVAFCMLRKRFINTITVGQRQKIAMMIMEALLVAGITYAGIMARIAYLDNCKVGNLFELATMKYKTPLVELTHGAENLYLHILHFICFLLGNNSYFCICFHLILTVLVGTVWYWAIRDLSGGVSAIVFLLFYSLDPYMTKQATELSPMPLLLLFYGIGLLLVAAYLRHHASLILISLLAGIWIGITGFMDLFGWTLLVFAFSIHHVIGEEKQAHKLTASLILLLGSVMGFLGMILIRGLHTRQSFMTVLNNWGSQYVPTGTYDVLKLKAYFDAYPDAQFALAAVFLCVFGLCSFYFRGKKERISPWICLLVLCVISMPLSCPFLEKYTGFVPGASTYIHDVDFVIGAGELIIMCMYVMAGLGIFGVLMPETYTAVEAQKSNAVRNMRTNYQDWKVNQKKNKEKKKSELLYAIDHPETMEGKGFIAIFLYNRAKQKIERQRDADKVMHALNSLSGDHIVIDDFSRDPHPEEVKNEKEIGLFHTKKHAENVSEETRMEEKGSEKNDMKESITEETEKEETGKDGIIEKEEPGNYNIIDKEENQKEEIIKTEAEREETVKVEKEEVKKEEIKKEEIELEKSDNTENKVEPNELKEGKLEEEKTEKYTNEDHKQEENKPKGAVRLLDNPLPLPKKLVFDPMDYDYEVPDDDDYDLKDDD